jgi:hypothetical protein
MRETGGAGWRRTTAQETFPRGRSHGSSGLAVHKVRCRGPEQQSKLNGSCDTRATARLARRYHSNVWQTRSWPFRKYRVKMVTASVTGAGTRIRHPA